MSYPSWDAALARVEALRKAGIWPGIIGPGRDGRYRLTYDPPVGTGQLDAHGYLAGAE